MPESLKAFYTVFAGLFGLLIGSFLNVCIFRLPRNCMSLVRPRSRCTKCLAFIAWYDNIPVVSWLVLGGRCRHCKAPISIRYPAIELLTGALFAYIAWVQLGAPRAESSRAVLCAVQAYLVAALLVCTFIDLEFRILPDEITLSGILLAMTCGCAFPFIHKAGILAGSGLPGGKFFEGNSIAAGAAASGLGALVGSGTTFVVRVLGELIFRKEAMGLGDVKFMGFLGGFLGWKGILVTFLLGCLAGALYGIGQYVFTRRLRGVQVPFGPFLAFGGFAMIFFASPVYRGIEAYLALFRRSV